MENQTMEFYDVKLKKKFTTDSFRIEERGGRFFAVAKSQEGQHECWRVLSKQKALEFKK